MEILCFFPVEIPTQQGDGYVFITKDVSSEILLQTGVETGNDITFVLHHIKLLMQHKDFCNRKYRDFTLVLHKHEEHRQAIEHIIRPEGGSLAIDDEYLTDQMIPVMEYLYERMRSRQQ